ncbi:MAG: hypothetical protein WDO15_27040 [Bacteroidota bacterium]
MFTGATTINSGGTFVNSGNAPVTFRGGITNNGTLTSGTGNYTFDTNSQSLGGSSGITVSTATATGITLTNNTTFTVNASLAGTGGLTQGLATSVLNLGGSSGISSLTASLAGKHRELYRYFPKHL